MTGRLLTALDRGRSHRDLRAGCSEYDLGEDRRADEGGNAPEAEDDGQGAPGSHRGNGSEVEMRGR